MESIDYPSFTHSLQIMWVMAGRLRRTTQKSLA